MATNSLRSQLIIWMNGIRVGVWSPPVSNASSLQYDPAWIESPERRVLSLSLPFTPGNIPLRGKMVTDFFDNLLPDTEEIRRRIMTRYGTRSTKPFDLLSAIGRECVGAIQLLSEGETPEGFDRIEGEVLDEKGVEQALNAAISGSPLMAMNEEEFRISIAGAQEKTAFLFHKGCWWRPSGSTPTTHIFKLPLGLIGNLQVDMQGSVENEWISSRIMNAFGLKTAQCEILRFGERKVLSVERFDRALMDGSWIARLPQEDFCQALGVPVTQKYENQGGPGIAKILGVLNASSTSVEDKRSFVKAQIVFWLMAATDGHAKNFSIFQERGGTYRLTPFYDVLSMWPVIGHGSGLLDLRRATMAMGLKGKSLHRKIQEIRPYHWDEAARLAGMVKASDLIEEIIEQAPGVLEHVDRETPSDFPGKIRDAIFEGIRSQTEKLKTA
jgi:serine/threonine-protein kinase HipA